jgi:uncharacterized protein YoxC
VTANAIFAAVAVGIFLLSCVVSWYLIQTLRQTRATALAAEQFLNGARPRVEAAADQLRSLMTRTERILTTVEEGGGTMGKVLAAVGQAMEGWKTGVQTISTVSALVAGAVQAWSSLSKPQGAGSPASAGGASHE